MALKQFWIGTVGPLYYDDEVPPPGDPDGILAGLSDYGGVMVEGTIKVLGTPADGHDGLRFGDIGILAGSVIGPTTTTNNAVVRWNSLLGRYVQNSVVTIGDTGNVNIPTGKGFKVNGLQVVTDRQTDETDASAVSSLSLSAGSSPVDLTSFNTALGTLVTQVNAIKTTLNNLLAKLRTHGLIGSTAGGGGDESNDGGAPDGDDWDSTPTPGPEPAPPGNDFSGDSNCVALWKFESGALTVDSKGTNTLTDNNTVGTETTDYKEGSACADLEVDNSEYFSITDVNLDSGFPVKNGGTGTFSICAWFKPEIQDQDAIIVGKWEPSGNSFWIRMNRSSEWMFSIATGSGQKDLYSSGTPEGGRWYHVGATYDASTRDWKFVIWDDTAGSKIVNASGTASDDLILSASNLGIGSQGNGSGQFDGLIDEVVVFKDILTVDEIDDIRTGTFS